MHGFILNMHFLWDLWGYKMKVSNKIIVAVLLLSMSAGITTGCKDSEITPEQNEWVSQIEQWYPDDEFTYNLFTLDEEPDMDKLKEQYPEFFEHDGPPAKGIEVYVWQTAEDSYWFGLMYGTNRSKTEEEIWALGETPLTLNEAKALLNECGVDKEGIFIIPVIQPFSSYAYEIDDGYRERVRKMFGLEE